MRTLRKLVLGETWILPLGIALVVGAAAIVSVAAESLWEDAGGPLLLAGTVGVLLVAVARER